MTKVHIVVDSTFRISPNMLAAHSNLHIVPLKVRLGTEEWPETELSANALLQLARERGLHPTTSQPAPGDYLKVFEPLIQKGREIVMIAVAGGLSGTVQGARMAAKMVNSQKIKVVDSTTTSVGGIKMTEAALKMAEQGLPGEEIAAQLTKMAEVTETILIPGELTFLQKGGRIGGAAALIGNILQIKPVLYLDNTGKVALLEKVRTKKRALMRAAEEVRKCGNLEYLAIGQIEAEDEAAELCQFFREAYPDLEVMTDMLSPVITAHVGPGTVGFVYQKKIK